MLQKYILYSISTPFAGYISEWGKVDQSQPPDGSTTYEYIQRKLSEQADLRVFLFPLSGPVITREIREAKKFDPVTETLVDQSAGDITILERDAANELAKAQSITTNLPSWNAVSDAVDAIGSLVDAKAFLKKLSRVVYWLAKNSPT